MRTAFILSFVARLGGMRAPDVVIASVSQRAFAAVKLVLCEVYRCRAM
jgi:hypothetical protein